MPELVPHKNSIKHDGNVREYLSPLQTLDFGFGGTGVTVELTDGQKGFGTCLGCSDIPCIELNPNNLSLPEPLNSFPGDPSLEVCPTNAICWDKSLGSIQIKSDSCIGCGLCALRCPYGAISIETNGIAVVEISDPNSLTILSNSGALKPHPEPLRSGQVGVSRSKPLQEIPILINSFDDIVSSRFVRNIIIQAGINCRTRRKGDTNIRMDGVLSFRNGRLGVLEIELGSSTLESPRALLEDMAILHGRYDISTANIDPISVLITLPNERVEYYQVIDDIQNVLNIKCRTITVGALLAVIWQCKKITGIEGELFTTSVGGTDLYPEMKSKISEAISSKEPYLGAFRTVK